MQTQRNIGQEKVREYTDRFIKCYGLEMPKQCMACGAEKRLAKHHVDYSEPLLIAVLCTDCHFKVHRWKIDCPQPIDLKALSVGRPAAFHLAPYNPDNGNSPTIPVTVHVTRELWAEIQGIAIMDRTNTHEIITEALQEYLLRYSP